MNIQFKLVEEKDTAWKHFTPTKVSLTVVGLIFFFTFLIMPFIAKTFPWFILYVIQFLCISLLILKPIAKQKHKFIIDYKEIGTINLTQSEVTTEKDGEFQQFNLKDEKMKLFFNSYRGGYIRRGESLNGVNELIIGEQLFKFLIRNDSEIERLKILINKWYHSNYDFGEFTRDDLKDRLIELNLDFEWKRLMEIKKNNK